MPQIIPYTSRSQTPTPRPVERGEDPFHGVERTIDLFNRIQEVSDRAEADNQAASAKAGIEQAIKLAGSDEQDPDVFKDRSVKGVQQIYSNTISAARNPRVRQLLSDKLGNDMINAATAIELTHKHKQVLGAKSNSFNYLQQTERELSQIQDPVERTAKEAQMAAHLRDTRMAGVWTPLEAAQLANGVLERDAYTRAYREIDISRDPIKDLATIQKRYPNLDPKQLTVLMSHGREREKEIERIAKEAEKKVHEENLLADTLDAVGGKIGGITDLSARAKARRYTAAETMSLTRAMETGGITDPLVATATEQKIREGKLTNYGEIANNPALDRAEKSRLMGLVEAQKDEKHFSKSAPYQEAVKRVRLAVSRKGPMESLEPKEQQLLLSGTTELWDRVGKGEDPIVVSSDIRARLTPQAEGDKPPMTPRFRSEAEVFKAAKDGIITRDDAKQQIYLLKQWAEYAARQGTKGAQPSTSSSPQRR
jgi:hypothetical protein